MAVFFYEWPLSFTAVFFFKWPFLFHKLLPIFLDNPRLHLTTPFYSLDGYITTHTPSSCHPASRYQPSAPLFYPCQLPPSLQMRDGGAVFYTMMAVFLAVSFSQVIFSFKNSCFIL